MTSCANQYHSQYLYDGLNRRRITRDYGWIGNTWVLTNETRYIYDKMLMVQERNSNNAVLVTYTRGLDLSGAFQCAGGIGGLLARTDSNGSLFYNSDGAGNVTALMNSQQGISARYMYNAFGKLLAQWGPMANINRMMFSSKEYDAKTGLYYYGERFYDPNLQRWLNRDPIGEYGGINLYGFVNNNPLRYVDPYGLWEWDDDIVQNALQNMFLGHPQPDADSYGRLRQQGLADDPDGQMQGNGGNGGDGGDGQSPGGDGLGNSSPGNDGKDLGKGKSCPKPSPNFKPPTNPPQLPPKDIPPGWRVRKMPPTEQYPNGYWKLEKPMKNGKWQGIDPSTGKPGSHPETHVPLPPQ